MILVDFTTDARNDLFDAVKYYESREYGLGKRLRDEVAMMLETAAHSPYLWRERAAGYRRINCPIFPYYIAYVIRDEVLRRCCACCKQEAARLLEFKATLMFCNLRHGGLFHLRPGFLKGA